MKREYLPITIAGLLFATAFFWSVWSETMRPMIRAGNTAGVVYHLVGIPIILVGLGLFVYGGFRFLRNIFDLLQDETFLEHAAVIKEGASSTAVRQAQKAHLRLWARAVARGSGWMLLGFSILGVGGYIINL